MNDFTKYCFGIVLATHCFAESASSSLPSGLIKVTDENNPKCIEYVNYQGEMYCSLVALDKSPVDPQIISYEKQNIIFDHRPWKAAWGKNTSRISTIEYIPIGDDIENWNELITTQFIPGLTNITPDQFGNRFFDNLKKSKVTFTVQLIENKPNRLIFEFKVSKPSNLKQDEIQKVVKGKDGMYILHYAIKKADMDEATRQKWIDNIKKSSIKDK
jgi:hypothetical protein